MRARGVVAAKIHQSDERALVRRKLATSVALTGDDEHRGPLDQGVREVERGRSGTNEAPVPRG